MLCSSVSLPELNFSVDTFDSDTTTALPSCAVPFHRRLRRLYPLRSFLLEGVRDNVGDNSQL